MVTEIRRGVLFTLVTLVLIGGVYNVAVWAIGQALFASQTEGSLLRRSDGSVIGSRLIAQKFVRPEYLQARPSGVDYNAASTGGTNYGPSNPDHLKAVQERLDAVTALEGVAAAQVLDAAIGDGALAVLRDAVLDVHRILVAQVLVRVHPAVQQIVHDLGHRA